MKDTWLYSLVAFWWWDKALGLISPGFDSHNGVGYDRVVPLVAR
ncbi:hypothetical protein HanIR_Chr00c05g0905091 [Helianthus annuus]|nr:hypothetical protein HanIR_Chr00c05g0905091 [Helianthus annuus]